MSNARFSILQAVAVSDRRVTDAQFRTLAALGMYADKLGWCYPSLKTLAADLKKSPQAVGRDTIALRKLGYLEVKNRYDSKTKSRHSNLYRLKYDISDFNMDDTPLSTSEVDTLSTPEVEVNALRNDPIKKPKGDLVDLEISKLPAKSIRQAVHEYFRLNTNWDTKYNRQWMEWAVETGITAEQIERAANTWRMDKQFNWQVPTLKGIFEKWQMLMEASTHAPTQTPNEGRGFYG